jgi:hypothetical protein
MPDHIHVCGGKVVVTTEEGQRIERPESELLEMLRHELLPPLGRCALPDGLKLIHWRDPLLLLVHQMPPHVRRLRWITDDSPEDFGPGTRYRPVRLSIPYAITLALYQKHAAGLTLTHNNELYFRNEPLRSCDDRLCYPALLNVSRIAMPRRAKAWICTQHLHYPPQADWTEQFRALLEHTWNGGFNRSSERHEGQSFYGDAKGVHRDLHPVERWEQATARDETFALRVSWKAATLCLSELIDCILEENRQSAAGWLGRVARDKPAPGLISRFLRFALRSPG